MGAAARQHALRSLSARPAVDPARRAVATRRHGVVEPVGPRPLVRATAGIRTRERPHLVLVAPKGRHAAHVVVVLSVVAGMAMLGAAAFQTQLAQRQVELDRLDGEISRSREQYEVLRRERAELRSPGRLAAIAAANGMVPAGDSSFLSIQPDVLAIVAASTGDIDPTVLGDDRSTLEDFREVKATTSGTAKTSGTPGTPASADEASAP